MQTMLTQVPRLIGRGIATLSPGLIGLALELAVPPLSLLVLAWIAVSVAAGAGTLVVADCRRIVCLEVAPPTAPPKTPTPPSRPE